MPYVSDAMARSFVAISRQAFWTAVPMKTVDRLADVCMSYGAAEVSPIITFTRSISTPSSWPAICASRVRAPCPMSEVPAMTVTDPSWRSRTIAYEAPVVADDLIPTANPRP